MKRPSSKGFLASGRVWGPAICNALCREEGGVLGMRRREYGLWRRASSGVKRGRRCEEGRLRGRPKAEEYVYVNNRMEVKLEMGEVEEAEKKSRRGVGKG